MDFSNFDTRAKSEEGAWMDITLPDGSLTDSKILILGRDSDVFKKRIQKVADQNRSKRKGLPVGELERASKEVYIACTVDWKNIEINKKALECTNENIRDFYEKYPWVLDQVMEFVEDRTNFL